MSNFCPKCGSAHLSRSAHDGVRYIRCQDCDYYWTEAIDAAAEETRAEVPARTKKKPSKLRTVLIVVAVLLAIGAVRRATGGGEKSGASSSTHSAQTSAPAETPSPAQKNTFILDAAAVTSAGPVDTGDLELYSGELRGVNSDGAGVFVVKAFGGGSTGKLLVASGFHNVADLILNHGFDGCEEIQYWAVANTTDGEEVKFISFTVPRNLIVQVAEGKVVAGQLRSYVEDLWILPGVE